MGVARRLYGPAIPLLVQPNANRPCDRWHVIRSGLRRIARRLLDATPLLDGRRRIYSQDGEDVLIASMFQHVATGFYVDIGCYHPTRFSNTAIFYQRGWRGINVDVTRGVKELFDRRRRRDINVNIGVSDHEGVLDMLQFEEGALNTLAQDRPFAAGHRQMIPVRVTTLQALLDQHLPTGIDIDFLSVDVEGLEIEVLRGNDWARYRPRVVCAEVMGIDLVRSLEHDVYRFLVDQGYQLYARTPLSMLFREKNFLPPYIAPPTA